MIAYVVELWCDRCKPPRNVFDRIVHSDVECLPGLGRNLIRMALEKGWAQQNGAMICPKCQKGARHRDQSRA